MTKLKRYSLTLDLYIHATDDQEAVTKAIQVAKEVKSKEDNCAEVQSIDEIKFGSLKARNIFTK